VYCANFYVASGARVFRSLGTEDESAALLTCAALSRLQALGAPDPDDLPDDIPARAVELYYGRPRAVAVRIPRSEPPPAIDVAILSDPRRRGEVLEALLDRERLKAELFQVTRDRDGLRAELASLRASVLGRITAAAERCPPIDAAITQFETHMLASTQARNARLVVAVARKFKATLPADVRTAAEVTPAHVLGWLDAETIGAAKAAGRRKKLRNRLGRFLKWCATTWGFPSPMPGVRAPSTSAVRRERGEIRWHELPEVEAALAGLSARLGTPEEPADPALVTYWKALIGTLAFAGLQLAELIWLRRADLQERPDGRRQLWITAVEDGHGGRHALKHGFRERAVDVHPERLWPLLEKHVKDGGAGEVFLFPSRTRQRARRIDGHPERWAEASLTHRLTGDPGGKTKEPRPALLPKGMTAASLRRTFGSLMLRDGVAVAAVAAAMGNTPQVVQEHYARILGSEVNVGF